MSRIHPVVGLVSGNTIPENNSLAGAIGEALVKSAKDYVLLSGGNLKDNTPKDAFLQKAVAAGSATNRAKVVGIIPDNDKPGTNSYNFVLSGSSDHRSLMVETGITSKQRNPLNGATPDVVIALEGDAGTLAEVAFAIHAGVPVILVGTGKLLTKFILYTSLVAGQSDQTQKLTKALTEGITQYFLKPGDHPNPAPFITTLGTYLNSSTQILVPAVVATPTVKQAAADAATANAVVIEVENALKAAPNKGAFLGLPGLTVASPEGYFNTLLDILTT